MCIRDRCCKSQRPTMVSCYEIIYNFQRRQISYENWWKTNYFGRIRLDVRIREYSYAEVGSKLTASMNNNGFVHFWRILTNSHDFVRPHFLTNSDAMYPPPKCCDLRILPKKIHDSLRLGWQVAFYVLLGGTYYCELVEEGWAPEHHCRIQYSVSWKTLAVCCGME